jgi:PAS domain S-box-containing protein
MYINRTGAISGASQVGRFSMPQVGHVLIGSAGQMLDMDAAFCDIMLYDPDKVRGCPILDVTAPADRQECERKIANLRETHRPFVIVKRLVRGDGSLVWVRNSLSITMAGGHAATVMATVEPVEAPVGNESPAILLDVARFLVKARRDRGAVCDPALFSEPGWDTVLAAYVAEAEGRAVDVATLAGMLRHAPATIERWVKALLQYDVLEIEYRNPSAIAPKAYRLTSATHRKLEEYLGDIRPQHRELAMHD